MNSVELIKCGTNDCKSRLHGCSCYLDDNNSTSTEYILCFFYMCMVYLRGSYVECFRFPCYRIECKQYFVHVNFTFPASKRFSCQKNSNQCYHIGSAFGETHVSTMTRNEWAFKALWNIYVQNMYFTMLRIKSQRQEAKENGRKSLTNGNIPVGMKFPRTHNNATHLDISKYVYTFLLNKVCSVLVPRWFLWKQFAICLCHFRAIFYTLICQLRGRCEETRCLFSVCDAHNIQLSSSRRKNKQYEKFDQNSNKSERIRFIWFGKTPFNWCRFAWHFMDVRSGVQNIKLRFVQQVKSIRFIFIQFKVKS